MRIGTIQHLWRYPVKSMKGEQLSATFIGPQGIPGDRGYAIRDERADEIRGAKKIPNLLQLSAHYPTPPTPAVIPPASIILPNGKTVQTDDPSVHEQLSQALGLNVTLWPRQPADNVDHYRRRSRGLEEVRQVLGLEEGEALPSFEGLPADVLQYVSPLGTYFDAYPLHLLTTSTLRALAMHHRDGQFVPERFRPNIVIASDSDAEGDEEEQLKGKSLRLGTVELAIVVPTIRCVMTTLPQGNLPKDPRILRTVVHQRSHHVGVYVTITVAGEVRVGDPVELLERG